jgi:ParB family chromosome partitioning protein
MAKLKDLGTVRDSFFIALNKLEPDLKNPRKDYTNIPDLAISMFNAGQLVPCEVRMGADGESAIVTAGHRRLKAAQYVNDHYNEWTKAGATGNRFEGLLCVSEPRGLTDDARIVRQIMQGEDRIAIPLNPIEKAKAYKSLIDSYGWTRESLAKKVGKSAQQIGETLKLLEAPKELQDAVEEGNMSATAASRSTRASPEKRAAAVEKAAKGEKVQVKDIAEYVPLTHKEAAKLIKKCEFYRDAPKASEIERTMWGYLKQGIEIGVGLRPAEFE